MFIKSFLDCDIYSNARHSVHCWFVHGQAMRGENVTVYYCRIANHAQGSAIEITHSNALVRRNEISGNDIGVHEGWIEAAMNAPVLESDSMLAESVRVKKPQSEWQGVEAH